VAATATAPWRAPSAGAAPARGAYGLRLAGFDESGDLLGPAAPGWVPFALSSRPGDGAPVGQWLRPESARMNLASGGHVDIDWEQGRAVFTLERPVSGAELLHPYLAPVAAVAAHRDGREGFHAGAVAVAGGAWAVLGDRSAGKSSLLALLGALGTPVIADDVVILDRERNALAGPRFVDLRAEASERLGEGKPIGVLGARVRFRMPVGAAPAATPLRGFVVLGWSDEPEPSVTAVPGGSRLERLFANRITRLEPTDARPLLDLSALPMVELRRPRSWERAGEAAEALLDALAAG
jgi:hypothetical protein